MTIRQSDLRVEARMQKSAGTEALLTESQRQFSAMRSHRRAFLSHSHLDQELALGLKRMFAKVGVGLYIDWLDLTMPAATNVETARKIQEAIRQSDYFLYLVTSNSSESIWCPWELGYADGMRTLQNKSYVVPTIGEDEVEYGKEYLGLYRVMDLYREDNGTKKLVYFSERDATRRFYFEG